MSVDGVWYLTITLQEHPGRYSFSYGVQSCQSTVANRCCTLDPECSSTGPFGCTNYQPTFSRCCEYSQQLDFEMVELERNSFSSPALALGNGSYNVTINKHENFYGLNITNVTGEVEQPYMVRYSNQTEVNITLPLGQFQVTGTEDRVGECRLGELEKPIVLQPLQPSYQLLPRDDLRRLTLRWSGTSDLPTVGFTILDADQGSPVECEHSATGECTILLDGALPGDHAPLKREYHHFVRYGGDPEVNSPAYRFVVDNTAYLPVNLTVDSESTNHVNLSWHVPLSNVGDIFGYRLFRKLEGGEGTELLYLGNVTSYVYHVFPDMPASVELQLGAIFRPGDKDWWGPVAAINVTTPVPSTGQTSLQPSISNVLAASISSVVPAAKSPVPKVSTLPQTPSIESRITTGEDTALISVVAVSGVLVVSLSTVIGVFIVSAIRRGNESKSSSEMQCLIDNDNQLKSDG